MSTCASHVSKNPGRWAQAFMLTTRHRAALKAERGIEAWHFEQYPNEAVFIPAGCPHQVRNLRPCIKVRNPFHPSFL